MNAFNSGEEFKTSHFCIECKGKVDHEVIPGFYDVILEKSIPWEYDLHGGRHTQMLALYMEKVNYSPQKKQPKG